MEAVLAGTPGKNGGTEAVKLTLQQLVAGDLSAADRLLPVVYDQLRSLADRMLRGGRPDHTLQPTALVHEVFLRMVHDDQRTWKDRAHFLNVCALAMRQILINYARDRGTDKRGGGWQRITLSGFSHEAHSLDVDAGALHAALEQLAQLNPRHYQVVVARFLGGLSVEEAALVLGVTERTVKRDWSAARVWLALQLKKAG
ncbi:MAG: sigma-70 family RNA polymerase sigma factor [Planctomycetes bacterium]|nr:sigma-70 family RNA polymerase sigma factor [Planctomycetota bacterium]MBI3836173.1 sigma-70 family RNA polymerase sigma factor [Planctomycetota bacterium]